MLDECTDDIAHGGEFNTRTRNTERSRSSLKAEMQLSRAVTSLHTMGSRGSSNCAVGCMPDRVNRRRQKKGVKAEVGGLGDP